MNYDLVVIGAGSGGLAAAERAAMYGARVAIAEFAAVGGACVNYGCIPEKLLDFAAGCRRFHQLAISYGWSECDRQFNWNHFIANKDDHIRHLNQLHRKHLEEAKVDLFEGHATFLDPHTVLVGDRSVTADKILIAVGAKPEKPDIPGIEHTITWRELYHLSQQPERIAIWGADPIGVKVSGSLNALGSEVTLIVTPDRILSGLDHEVSEYIQQRMTQHGIKLLLNTTITEVEKISNHLKLNLSNQPTSHIEVDTLLIDASRRPNLEELDLHKVGIQLTSSGAIRVDEYSRTTQVNIFAIGDCTDRMPLTPNAIAQARAFVDTEFGQHPRSVSYDWIPISISAHPEAASVGLSETKARQAFGDAVKCYYTQFRPLLYCLSQSQEKSWIKIVVNQQDSDRVLGVHMVGDAAVEIIQSLTVGLRLGATKQDLDHTIGIHPSSGEELFSIS